MAKLFDEILLKGIRAGQMPARTQESREWFRNRAQDVKKVNEARMIRESGDRAKNRQAMGRMYMYFYDPKWKEELPYYDRFPLVFPFAPAKGGFLGLNLHYLPYNLRAKLMDALYDVTNNKKYDETTKLKLSYEILNSSSKFDAFRPCIKHYLRNHLRSRFIEIYPSEWDIALFLPLERFEKKNKRQVWADSRKIIKGQKPKWK